MEHIDKRGLLSRLCGVLFVVIGLEEPVFWRPLDLEPGRRQAVGGHLDIGFSHDKIDIVAWLRPSGYPKGIPTAQREGNAVGLQRRRRTFEGGTKKRLIGCGRERR
jgi:hypothetical protein